jgi:hypothetical protein
MFPEVAMIIKANHCAFGMNRTDGSSVQRFVAFSSHQGSTDLILAARLNPQKALCGVENPRCSGTTAAVFA